MNIYINQQRADHFGLLGTNATGVPMKLTQVRNLLKLSIVAATGKAVALVGNQYMYTFGPMTASHLPTSLGSHVRKH